MKELPAPGTRSGPEEVKVRELGGILRRHRWFLLASLLVGAGLGLLLASRRVPSYEASTLILVRGEALPGLAALDAAGGQSDARQVSTEMELLQSRALARAVVDSLQLQVRVAAPKGARRREILSRVEVSPEARSGRYRFERQQAGRFAVYDVRNDRQLGEAVVGQRVALPGAAVVLADGADEHDEIELAVSSPAAAVDGLVSSLDVEQPGTDANLIRLRFRGSDPVLVRDISNALTSRYMALRESMQKSEARSTVSLLREQLDTVSRQLGAAEARLRSFRESAGVIDPQVESSTRIGRLSELQAQRAALDAERSALAGVLADVQAAEARGAAGSAYRRLVGVPSFLNNTAASEILRSIATLEERRTELLRNRRATDPEVQTLTAQIGTLEGQLQGMASTYLQGINGQVASIDRTLGQYQSQLAQTPAKEAEYARLSRQPQVLQQIYGQLQARLQEAEIARSVDNSTVRVVDPADLPEKPAGFGPALFAGAAGIVGLLVGLGVVLVREYTDGAVHTRADVQAAIGIPVLGLVPRVSVDAMPRWRKLPAPRLLLSAGGEPLGGDGDGGAAGVPALIVRGEKVSTPLSDAFSRLHANIMFARPDADMKILLMTSPLPGDGKTTTSVNFAATLAQSGLRVLLIDADLRRGRVHEAFGTPRGPGLTELLSENPVFEGVLRVAEVGEGRRLRYITCGSGTANPVQVLGSPVMRELLTGAAAEYDRIILDTPPLNLFPDAAVLGAVVDGVLVVARSGHTPFDALVDTAEQLRHATSPVVGAVLNEVDFERGASYDRSYRWYAMSKEYYHADPVASRGG